MKKFRFYKDSLNLYITNLTDLTYEIIKTPHICVKKYNNGMFESWAKTAIKNSEFSFLAIGNTSLYYAKYSNFFIGITATEILNIQTSAMSNGIVWATRPSLNPNKMAIDGYIVNVGTDPKYTTYIDAYVVGKWK